MKGEEKEQYEKYLENKRKKALERKGNNVGVETRGPMSRKSTKLIKLGSGLTGNFGGAKKTQIASRRGAGL